MNNLTERIILITSLIGVLLTIPATAQCSWQVDGNPICTANDDQWDPRIISDGGSGFFLVWHDHRNGNADIYAQYLSVDGTAYWDENGIPVCTEGSSQWEPQLVLDGAGGIIVAWRDTRLDESSVYAQRLSAAGTRLWSTDGIAASTIFGPADDVQLVSNGAGGAIAVWSHDPPGSSADLLAQRFNPDGSLPWGAAGILLCGEADDQYRVRAVADGSGGMLAAWQDQRSGLHRVFTQRLDASGAVLWTTVGVAVAGATDYQYDPELVRTPSGGAIVAWSDERGNDADIYVQILSATGVPSWPDVGLSLCGAVDDQEYPAITDDNDGGAIVTWKDQRVNNGDIYAQKLDALGVPAWTSDGITVYVGTTGTSFPQLDSDGIGGAIISWQFWGGETMWDLAAQRINSGGVTQWTPGGVIFCQAERDQKECRLASDGLNAVVLAWIDARHGADNAIYAQRIFHSGHVVSVESPDPPHEEPVTTAEPLLLDAYPNPFNPRTEIRYELAVPASVSLTIHDASGRRVRILKSDTYEGSGPHACAWDGRDASGQQATSGVYFYTLRIDEVQRSGKLVLVR